MADKKHMSELIVEFVDATGSPVKLRGFNRIKEWYTKERVFWGNHNRHNTGLIHDFHSHFNNCVLRLAGFETKFETFTDQNWQSKWSTLKVSLQETAISGGRRIYFSTSRAANLLVSLNESVEAVDAAYAYLHKKGSPNLNSFERINAYLCTWEFSNQEFSQLNSRLEADQKSLSQLRAETETVLETARGEVDIFKIELGAWKDLKNADWHEWLEKIQDKPDRLIEQGKGKIEKLASTYEEHLKLKAPAQYWSEQARKFRKTGIKWTCGLVASLAIGVALLLYILYDMPPNLQSTTSLTDRPVLILTALFSLIVYFSRQCAKMLFSSFHLMRDAEERELLTFLFLALTHESEIKSEERYLVFNALFSRSNSGLLSGTGSATVPGQIQEVLSGKTK